MDSNAPILRHEDRAEHSELAVMRITAAQRPLYVYIRSLVHSQDDVEDILQDVNLVLWRKIGTFDGKGPFLAWACHIAYLQVLAHLKKQRHHQETPLDQALLSDIAASMASKVEHLDERLDALRNCLSKLEPRLRGMILKRYDIGGSVQAIADELNRPAASVRVSLHRCRQALIECVGRTLRARGEA